MRGWPLLLSLQPLFMAQELQLTGGADFGDGTYQPNDMVTIHNVSNLDDGAIAKVIGFDPAKELYVVKDAKAAIWGLATSKLKALQTLDLEHVGNEWQEVPEGVVVPGGAEIKMDLSTGRKLARRIATEQPQQSVVAAAGERTVE